MAAADSWTAPLAHAGLRRRSLLQGAGATALAGLGVTAQAQQNVVRIVVGSTPGGSLDVVARILAPHMSATLGRTVVVENKPGASGTLAVRQVEAAAPDSQVFAFYPTASLAGFVLQGQEPVFERSTPISQVFEQFTVFAINPTLPGMANVHTIQDLIALAKRSPEPIQFGSPATASISHLTTERLCNLAGVKMQHVAYKGGPLALNDMVAGHLSMVALDMTTVSSHLGSPKVRALAVNFPQRVPQLPKVPTLGEAGYPDLASVVAWVTMIGPAKLPAAQVRAMNEAVQKAVADPALNKRMQELFAMPKTGTPQAAQALMARDLAYWRKVITDNRVQT